MRTSLVDEAVTTPLARTPPAPGRLRHGDASGLVGVALVAVAAADPHQLEPSALGGVGRREVGAELLDHARGQLDELAGRCDTYLFLTPAAPLRTGRPRTRYSARSSLRRRRSMKWREYPDDVLPLLQQLSERSGQSEIAQEATRVLASITARVRGRPSRSSWKSSLAPEVPSAEPRLMSTMAVRYSLSTCTTSGALRRSLMAVKPRRSAKNRAAGATHE